jgi:hypothetical protein
MLLQVACGAAAAAAVAAELKLQQARLNAEATAADSQQPEDEERTATVTLQSKSNSGQEASSSSSSSVMQAMPQLLQNPRMAAAAGVGVCAAGLAAVLPAEDLPALSSLMLVAYLLCAAQEVRNRLHP